MLRDLPAIWYGGAPAPWWLGVFEAVYRGLRALHQLPWRLGWRRPQRLQVPVVVVGNLTAGGTGKTPLVAALAVALAARGWRPGIVSRGYGGSERGPLLLDADSLPAEVGDEPCLLRLLLGLPVAIGRERVAAARLLLREGVDLVIADDGLQNPSLARDVEVCVIDGERRFGNGRLLPAGPLREPLERLASVDFRVVNGGIAAAGEIRMMLRAEEAVALAEPRRREPLVGFAGQRVHAVAGIGNPERFFASLRERGIEVVPHAFPDHHAYRAEELDFGEPLPVLMTAKDAVKCVAFARPDWWQVPVEAELPAEFIEAVAARLLLGAGASSVRHPGEGRDPEDCGDAP